MFTGDASGGFLFPTLHEVGLASKADASSRRDGMALEQTIISAVGRCAPPQNKPTPKELSNCRPFWQEEIRLLKHLKVVVALGKIAHDEYVWFQKCRLVDFPFQHGAVHRFTRSPVVLVDTYHPSRQNTNTGKLTKPMFRKVFRQVIELAGQH
jgi:uracil-DNA glycosylase